VWRTKELKKRYGAQERIVSSVLETVSAILSALSPDQISEPQPWNGGRHGRWETQVAFPSGSMEFPGKEDMSYMRELLQMIEREGVPAPAPIEQRWTAGSSASLSIAADVDPDSVHSWVRCVVSSRSNTSSEWPFGTPRN